MIVFWRVDQMFLKAQDCISQTLEIDDKYTRQLSHLNLQEKDT